MTGLLPPSEIPLRLQSTFHFSYRVGPCLIGKMVTKLSQRIISKILVARSNHSPTTLYSTIERKTKIITTVHSHPPPEKNYMNFADKVD